MGFIRRFDDLGRVVVPKDIRNALFQTTDVEGMSVEFSIYGDNIVLRPIKEEVCCVWKAVPEAGDTELRSYRTDCGMERLQPLPGSLYCDHCGKKIRLSEN